MSSKELETVEEIRLAVAMVQTFLIDEKSSLKTAIKSLSAEDKPLLQAKLDTVSSLLKDINRVRSYLMGIAKENKNE